MSETHTTNISAPDAKAVTLTIVPANRSTWTMFEAGFCYGAGALVGACTVFAAGSLLGVLFKAIFQ